MMKKGYLVGGLVTRNIIGAMKEFIKSGGKKTYQIVKDSGVSRKAAKQDIRSGLSNRLKSKRNFAMIKIDQNKNPKTISQIDKLKKYRQEKKDLTRDINKLK